MRETLELALEALDSIQRMASTFPDELHEKHPDVIQARVAITAIKEALPAPQGEPVAWFKHGPYEDGEPLSVVFENPGDDVLYSPLGFIDAPPAPTPECNQGQVCGVPDPITRTVYEPVGEAEPFSGRSVDHTEAVFLRSKVPVGTKLYTGEDLDRAFSQGIAEGERTAIEGKPTLRVYGWVWKDKREDDNYIPSYTPAGHVAKGELLALVNPADLHEPLQNTEWD